MSLMNKNTQKLAPAMVPRLPKIYLQPTGRRQIGMPKTDLQIPVRTIAVIGVTNLEGGNGKKY